MSDQDNRIGDADVLRPQVIGIETPQETRASEPPAPRVIETAQTGRIVPSPPSGLKATAAPRRRRGYGWAMRLGLAGLIAAFCGWAIVDLYLWIASAFSFSTGLGWAAAATALVGVAAAGAMIGHEMRSYFALRNVEANQERLKSERLTASEMQEAIREVVAEIPKDGETKAAIERFQRKVQRHHSPTQQIDLLSQTVMKPLDRRAEAIVRRASARAFGITAISPTVLTDVLFFIVVGIRMVREIAACYGHRPTALATAHLLRRVVVEAGRLGAVDFAGAAIAQHIGAAVAERVATSAAESMYAAQRLARLGLVTIGLCRPIPFREHEVPGILSSLIGNLFTPRADSRQADEAMR